MQATFLCFHTCTPSATFQSPLDGLNNDRPVIYDLSKSVDKGNTPFILLMSTPVHKKVYAAYMSIKCLNIKNKKPNHCVLFMLTSVAARYFTV